MNLPNLLSSTTNVLLFLGLAVLLLNVIFSAVRLSRGHVRIGIVNVVLVLGACVLIAIGLVRMTFPALAGTAVPTVSAATGAAASTPGNAPVSGDAASSGALSAPQQMAVASGPVPAAGTMPAMISGPNDSGSPAEQGNGQAGQSGQSIQVGSTATGISSSTGTIPSSRLAAVTAIGGGVILLAGLLLYFGERRRQEFEPSSSAGLLYTGAGVFVLLAALVVPGLPGQFGAASAGGTGVASIATSSGPAPTRAALRSSTPTVTPVPSSTPTVLPTLTPVSSDSPTPLFTAVAYAASTDVSTTTACSVTAQTALNLRGDPSTQQQAIGKVFAGSLLPVTGQSANKKWWRVISNDGGAAVEGWVSADFVSPMSGCAADPVPVVGPTLTPSRTPRPSTTPRPSATSVVTASAAQDKSVASETVTSCTVMTTTAVSLRLDPSRQRSPIAQIPENTALTATSRSSDDNWWHVTYSVQGTTQEGWVGAGAVIAASACSALPSVTATPIL
jgi:uncharacterized protein YgiM (DUF1202 family)